MNRQMERSGRRCSSVTRSRNATRCRSTSASTDRESTDEIDGRRRASEGIAEPSRQCRLGRRSRSLRDAGSGPRSVYGGGCQVRIVRGPAVDDYSTMNSKSELENYESPRSIEPLSQRELMLDVGAALLAPDRLQAMLAGSLVDEPMSSSAAWVGTTSSSPARLFVVAISMLTWARRIDDDRTFLLVNVSVAGSDCDRVVPQHLRCRRRRDDVRRVYRPSAIFCGQFLSLRELASCS